MPRGGGKHKPLVFLGIACRILIIFGIALDHCVEARMQFESVGLNQTSWGTKTLRRWQLVTGSVIETI